MKCSCESPGYCPVFKRNMNSRSRQICRGEILTPEKCAVYRANWAAVADLSPGCPLSNVSGPGTDLEKLLSNYGINSCGVCKEWIARMNLWGVSGCKENRHLVIARIKEAAGEQWITEQLRVGWAMSSEPWFRLIDPFGSLVDEAIRRAEEREKEVSARQLDT